MASGSTTFSAVIQSYIEEGGVHLSPLLSWNVETEMVNHYNLWTSYYVYAFQFFVRFIEFTLVFAIVFSAIYLVLIPMMFMGFSLMKRFSKWVFSSL